MSTDQQQSSASVDPELVEQTKQQIQSLVREIADLAKQDLEPQAFYSEFLPRVVQALAAVGGAVWVRGEGSMLQLAYQINLQRTGLAESENNQFRHGRLLHQVIQRESGMLVPPQSGAGDDNEAGNPTDFLLVLGPLKSDQQIEGVVEIFQRPGTRPNTQRGYLRFLEQMCELAGDFLKTRQLRHYTNRQTLWAQLEHFTRLVHESLDPRETAYTVVNEGRRLIQCDRVSVALKRGRKCTIEAISGQDIFDKRSNTVQLLGRLATAVAASGDPLWYSGDTSDLPPQVEEAVQDYVDDSHSKMVAVLPLKKPVEAEQDPDEGETIGALVVEQIEDSRLRDGFRQRVDVVCAHSSVALANAMEYHSLFLLPLWRAIGRAKWVVQARTLPKTIAVTAALLLAVGFLALWPKNFYLEGEGKLVPIVRRNVFAPMDGSVAEVFVEHNQPVTAGQVLLRLRNTDLDVAMMDVIGRLETTNEQIAATQRTLLDVSRGNRAEQIEMNRLQGELLQAQQRRDNLIKQIELYRRQKEELLVRSPISGRVITWEVKETLKNRPVQRGQILLRVADPEKGWELEVEMPEKRVGHIAEAQRSLGEDLPVEYILATEPDDRRSGKIEEVHYAAEVKDEKGNTVRIRVAIRQDELPEHLRPGATAIANVYCGRRPLGYVLFHDLLEWVQTNVLFRFF